MPTYRYKAISEPGGVLVGDMEAPNQEAVIEHLRSRGLLPLKAEEARAAGIGAWFKRELSGRENLNARETADMVRGLATLLRAGLPLDQALDMLINFSDAPTTRAVLKRIVERVRGGASLADAFSAEGTAFDRFLLGMLRAGESGGTLDTVLEKTAIHMENSQKTRQNLKSALIYPVILVVTAIISVGIIVTVVIPRFGEIFSQAGIELPLATRIVLTVGTLTSHYWWLPVVGLLLVVLFLKQRLRNLAFRERWDRWRLRWPLLGSLFVKSEVARLTYTLGMLISNGVPMLQALSISRATLSNAAMAKALQTVEVRVKEGKTVARPLAETGLFPKLATQLITIGEESGRLESMLFRVAETYEVEVQRATQRLITLLVPAMTVIMAILIAGIILSIFIPMMSINELAT